MPLSLVRSLVSDCGCYPGRQTKPKTTETLDHDLLNSQHTGAQAEVFS